MEGEEGGGWRERKGEGGGPFNMIKLQQSKYIPGSRALLHSAIFQIEHNFRKF